MNSSAERGRRRACSNQAGSATRTARGKLVRLRVDQLADEPLHVELAALDLGLENLEQFGMAGVVVGAEVVHRMHQAMTHELAPQPIGDARGRNRDCPARSSQPVSSSLREKSGFVVGLAPLGSSLKSLGKGGSFRSSPPRNLAPTGLPFCPGFCSIAGPVNITSPVRFSPIEILLAVLDDHEPGEERGHAVEIELRPPVLGMIVALGARQLRPQEDSAHRDHRLFRLGPKLHVEERRPLIDRVAFRQKQFADPTGHRAHSWRTSSRSHFSKPGRSRVASPPGGLRPKSTRSHTAACCTA